MDQAPSEADLHANLGGKCMAPHPILISIVLIVLLLSGCARGPDKSISTGGLTGYFEHPTNIIGKSSVKIISQTPASIVFKYNSIYVSLFEVTNAAQAHCEKYYKNAEFVEENQPSERYWSRKITSFKCVQ